MIHFLQRHSKDYSRYNMLKEFTSEVKTKHPIYLLMPFSKNQFIKHFSKRKRVINDFFISNYDTYVYDRKKISKYNPRAWWKFFQDWINFKFSSYILSDTNEHFLYWETLFGKTKAKHFVIPVLADKNIYFPDQNYKQNSKVKILFFGSFIPLHGIDIILKALKILENEKVEFEAEIIGNGQMYTSMKNLYNHLELKNVTMNGEFIKETKLADKIRSCDIVLGIFGDSKKAKSVVPNKVYQALACKKALITMNSKPINEFFNQNDMFLCQNTPEDLAKTIKYVIDDTSEKEKKEKNGFLSFEKLYKKTKEDLISIINQVDSEQK